MSMGTIAVSGGTREVSLGISVVSIAATTVPAEDEALSPTMECETASLASETGASGVDETEVVFTDEVFEDFGTRGRKAVDRGCVFRCAVHFKCPALCKCFRTFASCPASLISKENLVP